MNTLASKVLITTVVFLATATCVVFLRFVSQRLIVRRVQLHDYVMLLGWLYSVGMCSAICYGTFQGVGERKSQLSTTEISPLGKSIYAFSVLYNPVLMAIKSSILFFYLQLSKGHRAFRLAVYITLGVVNMSGLVLMLINIFRCHPVEEALKIVSSIPSSCIDLVALYLASAPVNIITDIAIFCLPLPFLKQLRLPRRQKIVLVITFGTGLFVIVIGVIRTVYLQTAVTTRAAVIVSPSQSNLNPDYDLSWVFAYIFLWSAIEVNLGIVCGSVPMLKPFVKRVFPRFFGGRRRPRVPNQVSGQENNNPEKVNIEHPPIRENGAPGPSRPTIIPNVVGGSTDGCSKELTPIQEPSQTQSAGNDNGHMTFFDFIIPEGKINMLEFTVRESVLPLVLISVIFFLSGFIYGFLDNLNAEFRMISGYSSLTSFELHATFFCAYFVSPLLVALPILKRGRFKVTLITGLSIYALGSIIFWPSAVLLSLPAFFVSNFIVGAGLAVIETSVNLFASLCGPMRLSETRLNLVRCILDIGRVFSPFLAEKVLFVNVHDVPSLIRVQWTYLGIALFAVLLAVTCYYLPTPDVTDEELENIIQVPPDQRPVIYGVRLTWVTLSIGSFSLFCSVGARECLETKFQTLVAELVPMPSTRIDDYLAIAHSLWAVGSFATALMILFIQPRRVLAFLYMGAVLFAILTMNLAGYLGITMVLLVFLFGGGIFATTFAMCLRGMGGQTKLAASILVTAEVGGAPFPVIQNFVHHSNNAQYAVCVIVAVLAGGALFPLYLNIYPPATRQVKRIDYESRIEDSSRNVADGPGLEVVCSGVDIAMYHLNSHTDTVGRLDSNS